MMETPRDAFLAHVRHLVEYWDGTGIRQHPNDVRPDRRWRLDGLAFGILVALDGFAGGVPAFAVVPIDEDGGNGSIEGDIAGSLHDDFYPHLST